MAPGNRKSPKRAESSDSRYSLMEFMRDFPDDETCLTWLWRTRYATNEAGTEANCPRCNVTREFQRYETKQQRQSWTCTGCGHHVHPTAGTVFHKSSTSLHLWFYAMYLMSSTRCGISAKQLERELGVTYKTAWRMFTLIRNELMAPDNEPMSGTVEMDEMYVGGKPHQSDRAKWDALPNSTQRRQAAQEWSRQRKTPVFGMAERGGQIAAHVVPKQPQREIMGHIARRIEPDAVLYTDEAAIYRRLPNAGWQHRTVNHAERIYVSGDVHTNTIEGFWMLIKTGITGAHHHVSAKWLQGYLNEYVWRYNNREHQDGIAGPAQFLLLLLRAASVPR